MSDPEWLRPSKVLDYCVRGGDIVAAAKKLHQAVLRGRVRARYHHDGTILDPRWFQNQTFDDNDPYALPPDVELSVEDAKREFGD